MGLTLVYAHIWIWKRGVIMGHDVRELRSKNPKFLG